MKQLPALCTLIAGTLLAGTVSAQPFKSGSDGSYGPINVTENTVLEMPANGIFHCTTITVAQGATLSFQRNGNNTPVHLLATGNVTIAGNIYIYGTRAAGIVAGLGGPGGFDGGKAAIGDGILPGSGYGPGGGRGGVRQNVDRGAAPGLFLERPNIIATTNVTSTYGNAVLIPIIGGSGGGGSYGLAGAGGGGAILIASDTRIDLTGVINASGGLGNIDYEINSGSGGGVRLVAPIVAGNGTIEVRGGNAYAGIGRVRIDTLDNTNYGLTVYGSLSMGSMMVAIPNPMPRLDVTEVAGRVIEDNSGPVYIQLPFGSDPNIVLKVRASNVKAKIPIQVVLTPDSGDPILVNSEIDNTTLNPATVTVPVTVPVNQHVAINVWKR